jgi:hypothetical protein
VGTSVTYIETNFLMGVATGRESQVEDLLSMASAAIRIVIPSACYLEAFSALEDERKRRNGFKNQLEQQIGQLRRDTTSPHAKSLLTHLEESLLVGDRLLSDIQERLFRYVDRAAGVFESIDLLPQVLRDSLHNVIISDPTDNLILHVILDHARRTPSDEKALLTGNYTDFDTGDVRTALQSVGINKYFRSVGNLTGWLRSLPS